MFFLILKFPYNSAFIMVLLTHSDFIIKGPKYRRLRWAGHVARLEKGRGVLRILIDKPTKKMPPERPRCGWGQY